MQTIIAHWRAFRLTAVTRLFVNLNIHRPTTSLIAATSKSDRCSPDPSEREVERDRLGIYSEPPTTPCSAMKDGLGLFEILDRKLKLKAFLSATVRTPFNVPTCVSRASSCYGKAFATIARSAAFGSVHIRVEKAGHRAAWFVSDR
jgi:hypothetical protein